PEDEKTYVHRISRTGRAGKEGVAVTLVDWDEIARWKVVSDELGLAIDEPVETYSTSEHLYSDLGIPTSATGRLPMAQRTRAGLAAEYVTTGGAVVGRKRPRARSGGEHAAPATPVRPRRPRTRTRGGRVETEAAPSDAGPNTAPTAGPEAVPDPE